MIGKNQAKGSGAAVVTVPTSVKSLMLRMVDTGPKLGGGRNFSKLQVGLEMIFRFSAGRSEGFCLFFSVSEISWDELGKVEDGN